MGISVQTWLMIGLIAGVLLHAFATEISRRSARNPSPSAGRFIRTYLVAIVLLALLTLQAYLLSPPP